MSATHRLDAELVRRGLARSRGQARELLEAGVVLLDGAVQTKPSAPVGESATLELTREPEPWVGRAAHKLLGALEQFAPEGLEVAGTRCLDVGASTGGFTQVLLRAGAAHVTALDVGHGQLAALVADDPRVTEVSGTNIRDVRAGGMGAPYDVVVADLSFISLRLTLEPMAAQLTPQGQLVALVKPQFEVGRDNIGRTGVVGSATERRRVLRDVLAEVRRLGLRVRGLVRSPLPGGDGNREYLLWVSPQLGREADADVVETLIEQVEGKQ